MNNKQVLEEQIRKDQSKRLLMGVGMTDTEKLLNKQKL